MKPQGPNVKKLIIWKMSRIAVPPGTRGSGMAEAVDLFMAPGKLSATAQEATSWVASVLAAVKAASDNPYGDDDEAIAGAVLAKIEALKARPAPGKG